MKESEGSIHPHIYTTTDPRFPDGIVTVIHLAQRFPDEEAAVAHYQAMDQELRREDTVGFLFLFRLPRWGDELDWVVVLELGSEDEYPELVLAELEGRIRQGGTYAHLAREFGKAGEPYALKEEEEKVCVTRAINFKMRGNGGAERP